MSRAEELGELKEVVLDQGTIRYRERGVGEPILFVHGLLVNGDLWRKVVPDLADDFRCIVPDWPLGSHAVALAADADLRPPALAKLIADFLAALDLENVTLVGNDTGGALCQIVVTEHPERIARLALTDCDAYENFPPAMFRYLLWSARVPGLLNLLAQSMRLRPLRRLPIAFGWLTKRPIDQEFLDSYLGPVASSASVRRDATKLLKAVSPHYTLAAAEKLGTFQRPVLIAWAPQDRFFPFSHAEKLREEFPKARLEAIEDSYTFVPEDQPKRLAELIAAFMREPTEAPA